MATFLLFSFAESNNTATRSKFDRKVGNSSTNQARSVDNVASQHTTTICQMNNESFRNTVVVFIIFIIIVVVLVFVVVDIKSIWKIGSIRTTLSLTCETFASLREQSPTRSASCAENSANAELAGCESIGNIETFQSVSTDDWRWLRFFERCLRPRFIVIRSSSH